MLTLNISQVAENGSTANPTIKSATANDTMNKLVTERNFDEQKTAAITKQLPTITSTLINANIANEANSEGSVHETSSNKAAHADAFIVLRICSQPPTQYSHLITLPQSPIVCDPVTHLEEVALFSCVLYCGRTAAGSWIYQVVKWKEKEVQRNFCMCGRICLHFFFTS